MRITLALLAGFAVALASCAPPPPERLVPPDYRSWRRLPAEPLRNPVPGHLDSARVVYVNPIGMAAARAATGAARAAFAIPRARSSSKRSFPASRPT